MVTRSPVWGLDFEKDTFEFLGDGAFQTVYEPRAGGLYRISSDLYLELRKFPEDKKILVSHKIAKHNLKNKIFKEERFREEGVMENKTIIEINSEFLKKVDEDLKNGLKVPRTEELCERLLFFLSDNSSFGDGFLFDPHTLILEKTNKNDLKIHLMQKKGINDVSLDPRQLSAYCYARKNNNNSTQNRDLEYLVSILLHDESIDVFSNNSTVANSDRYYIRGIRVSPKGRSKIYKSGKDSKKVFVGMWFDELVEPLYSEILKPNIISLGLESIRINETDHDNKIDDQIMLEIRRSRLVLIDLTAEFDETNNKYIPRGSVYFEAGFAKGLKTPVVWTCREDILDSKEIPFDVSHYSIIPWEEKILKKEQDVKDEEEKNQIKQAKSDFEKRLKNRIQSLIL